MDNWLYNRIENIGVAVKWLEQKLNFIGMKIQKGY
jgi:hypothetical protein